MFAGSSNRGLHRSSAFTVLELVMVLALFGLVAGLVVGTGATMFRQSENESVEQKTLSAIATARRESVASGEILELRYDEKSRVLDWGKGNSTLSGEDILRLLPPARVSAMLIGGRVVEASIPLVRFHPDGTCDPFRVEIVQNKTSRITAIDPWTCTALTALPAEARR
ncbi:pilus assembly FimT family protein [Oleiharenicola lentus]|uniref:pilus assembly FimT family protein n=1 Tax=Oleiharenicola lentus TaxID=2508720 RepID=UPI003F67E540